MTTATPAATTARVEPTSWVPMIFIGLGISMVIMDSTIVNVSLPSIIRELQISSIDAEWVNAIYSLVFASLLIIFGRLGDRLGRRGVFMAGAIVFAVASIVAARSDTGTALIAARALQGVGGAMIAPTSLSLINSTYRGRDRTIAFAIYGSIIGGMAAIGPLLGGYLTEYHSWRWAFYINVPIAIILVVGTLLKVSDSRDELIKPGLDVMGAVLSALGIGSLVFALIEGRNYGWFIATDTVTFLKRTWPAGGISPVAAAFAVSALSLCLLVVVERRRVRADKSALLDLSLFAIPTFGFGSIAALIVSLGEFGILFALPLFLQTVQGYTALGAGAVLAALAVGAFVSATGAARLSRTRSQRFVARLGLALEVVAILALGLLVSTSVSGAVVSACLFVYGLGVGFASAQLTGLILADVPIHQSGQASGTQSTARQIGSAMGTAVLGTVLFVSLGTATTARVGAIPGVSAEQAQQVSDIVSNSAGVAIPGLAAQPGGEVIAAAAGEAFAHALSITAYVAAGFVSLGLLATLALPPEGRAREEEEQNAPTPSTPLPA